MSDWNFVSRKFLLPQHKVYDELCAPAVFVMKDEMYVIGSTHEPTFPIWKSKNPTKDEWEIATDSLKVGAWDPGFLYDEEKDKLFYTGIQAMNFRFWEPKSTPKPCNQKGL